MSAQTTEKIVFGFLTGEVAPKFAARSDVDKLNQAARKIENMTLGPFGYAERRTGFQFIAYTKDSYPS